MLKRFKRWNQWQKRCLNPWWYKLLVLFALAHSPALQLQLYYDEL